MTAHPILLAISAVLGTQLANGCAALAVWKLFVVPFFKAVAGGGTNV